MSIMEGFTLAFWAVIFGAGIDAENRPSSKRTISDHLIIGLAAFGLVLTVISFFVPLRDACL